MRRSPKAATFFLARLETAIGHWFEIFTPILIIAATHP
jgi:hypothetical protein